MLDLSSVIQQRDHEPIITAAVFGNANATKKRWEEEGKNVEEEIQKQKERGRQIAIDAKNNSQIEKLDKDKRQNYFLQLKVAKETSLNKSLATLSPIIIGEPLSRGKQEKGECICKKYNFAWSGVIKCEERKKVL